MRRVGIILAIIAVMMMAIALVVDVVAPPVSIGLGTVGLPIDSSGLTEQEPETDCDRANVNRPCRRDFAYAPGGSLIVWVSIRNNGSLDLTLQDIDRQLLDPSAVNVALSHPVRAFDGGDALTAAANGPRTDPFGPITLASGHERVIGLEFRTTEDVTEACEHWEEGTGVGWDRLTIGWSWLVFRHEQAIPFATQLVFRAPLAADCHR